MKKKNSIITIFILAAVVLLAIIFACIFAFSKIKAEQKIINKNTQSTKETTVKNIEGIVIEGDEFNTYRNEKFGFEFQFPKNLIIRENSFGSYYSKFNAEIVVVDGKYKNPAVLFNVVLPEFPDRSFASVKKNTSKITINGTGGEKYEYEFEGIKETAIILPLGEYKIILGTEEKYQGIFDQIIPTFKFLK